MSQDSIQNQTSKIIAIYRITSTINGKIYIGQSVDYQQRWRQHKAEARKDEPSMIINKAMKKHGINNFLFEVVDFAQNYWQADCLEQNYIKQYNSHIRNDKGYNVSLGGPVAPKSEEWLQAMQEWRESLSDEEKEEINRKRSEATLKQITEQGHPGLGTKRTDEQKANISAALKALDKSEIYTPEVRQKMSEAHVGHTDSEETKQKKAESATKAWAKRIDYSELKCNAPDCEIKGKAAYKILDEVRYCNKHGLRLLRYGRLDRIKL